MKKLKDKILNTFNIKPDESKAVILLLLFSFFLNFTIAYYLTASTSLFMFKFSATYLPYIFLASAVIAFIVNKLSAKINKKLTLVNYFFNLLVFALIMLLVLGVLSLITDNRWVYFFIYIFFVVFAIIRVVVFWGLAGKLFNLRQGKRLFGLISSGEVVSNILSYLSIPLLQSILKTNYLIIISTVGIFFGILIYVKIIRKYRDKLNTEPVKSVTDQENSTSQSSIRKLLKKKYFLYLFLLAIFPAFGVYFVEYVFLVQVKIEFPDKELFAKFYSIFAALVSVIELFTKSFSGRLMQKYGLKLGLSMLPIMLALSTFLTSLTGTFFGITTIFFSFILLSKLFERIFRTGFNDPAFQVLYQPFQASERLYLQSRIEGISKTIGNLIVGSVLLIFINVSILNFIHFNYFLLFIVIVWFRIAYLMSKEYKNELQHSLNQRKLSREGKRNFSNPNELFDYYLKSLIQNQRLGRILTIISKISPINFSKYINSNKIGDVINKNSDAKNISERAQIESEKAGKIQSMSSVLKQIDDKDNSIKREALITAGKAGRKETTNIFISNLKHKEFECIALEALNNINSISLIDLEKYFLQNTINKSTKVKLIKVIELSNSSEKIKYLRNKLNSPEKAVRDKAIASLSNLKYIATNTEKSTLKEILEEEVEFSVWLLACISDFHEENKYQQIIDVLYEDFEYQIIKIFNVLSLFYDNTTIQLVKNSIASGSFDDRSYALEILDITLSEDIKPMVLPLLDTAHPNELISRYAEIFPQQQFSEYERLIEIVNKDYSKLSAIIKALALNFLHDFNTPDIEGVIVSHISHPKLLIKETALRLLYNFDNDLYFDKIIKLKPIDNIAVGAISQKIYNTNKPENKFILEKIDILKKTEFFSDFSYRTLSVIAQNSTIFVLQQNEKISNKELLENCFFVVSQGAVSVIDTKKQITVIHGQSEYFGDPFICNSSIDDYNFIANRTSIILCCYKYILYNLLYDNPDRLEAYVKLFIENDENLNPLTIKPNIS